MRDYLTKQEIAEITGCKPAKVVQIVDESGLAFGDMGVPVAELLTYLFTKRLLKDTMQQTELANAIGCTQGLISQRCSEAGIAPVNGGYRSVDVLRELFKNRDTDELTSAKLRKERAVARIMEMRRDELEGKLIAMSEAEEICEKAYKPIAEKIRLLPKRLAGRIVGLKSKTEALKLLTDAVEKILREQIIILNKINVDVEEK